MQKDRYYFAMKGKPPEKNLILDTRLCILYEVWKFRTREEMYDKINKGAGLIATSVVGYNIMITEYHQFPDDDLTMKPERHNVFISMAGAAEYFKQYKINNNPKGYERYRQKS